MPRKLKLLLDEDIGKIVADALRAQGHDVASVIEESPGASDEMILRRAKNEQRLLLTLDKDFGYLIYVRLLGHGGVILLRLDDESPATIIKVITATLQRFHNSLKNRFVVASEERIRIR